MSIRAKTGLKRKVRAFRARHSKPVEAEVDLGADSARIRYGEREIFFRSRNLPERPRRTADFALLALSLAALSRGRNFRLNAPVTQSAYEHRRRYMWFWRTIDPKRFAPARVECPIIVPDPELAPDAGSLICLSGGVDSTYALLNNPGRYRHGLLLKGADYPVDGPSGFDELESRVCRIAGTQGLAVGVVETNLRDIFGDWEALHSGMLVACLRFALADVGRGAYAADYTPMQEALVFPWGNMRAVAEVLSSGLVPLDHLHSDVPRTQKVAFLARQPEEVLSSLTVCYETPHNAQNCGKCRKCMMTRLALQAVSDPSLREGAEVTAHTSLPYLSMHQDQTASTALPDGDDRFRTR